MTNEENLSAVLYGVNDLRLENLPIPEIEENDVLLRMSKVGICGSDVSYLTKGRIDQFVVTTPMVIGHEASGIVVKCGSAVRSLKEGDRVAVEPGVPCRFCSFCKNGRYNLCPDMKFCATPPINGNLCRFYKHASDFCYKLPEHVTLEEGALLEPLSVAVHACRRAEVGVGSRVLICGAGPIGLVCLMTAKAMGASVTCITDIVQSRLDFAKKLGADFTVNTAEGSTQNLLVDINELMNGNLFDITIECSGAELSIKLGISATRTGGCMVLVGMGPSEINLPLVNAAIREVDIKGVFRYVNCYPTALELVASGLVDLKPLVSHRFELNETHRAFDVAKSGKDGAIKVMISC